MRISLKLKTILGVALIEATLLALLLTTTFNLLTNLVNDAVVKRANTTANLFYSTTKNAFTLRMDFESRKKTTGRKKRLRRLQKR